MMQLLTRFDGRRFQMWSYTVSHRQLLLRSNKSEGRRRCEVLFSNVARFDLPTSFDDLEILIGDEGTLPDSAAELGADSGTHRKRYLLRGINWSGYVVAGGMATAEDDAEYYEASSLFSQHGL
jgi:hypothetical protein